MIICDTTRVRWRDLEAASLPMLMLSFRNGGTADRSTLLIIVNYFGFYLVLLYEYEAYSSI